MSQGAMPACRPRHGPAATSADAGRYFEPRRHSLRGRRPVRADHRLRVDEKHIHAQSAILDKTPPLSSLLSITVFSGTDVLFIRTGKQGWRAERAMPARRHRRTYEDTSNCGDRACADGVPSARIVHSFRAAAFLRSSSRSRSTRRCTLPVVVMGSASMNSISFGYS